MAYNFKNLADVELLGSMPESAKVLIADENVISEWEQPGSTNPYMTGNKVSYNGKIWVSTIDNNVWAPGAYGWEEITE